MKKVYIACSFAYEDKSKREQRESEIERISLLLKDLNPDFDFFMPHKYHVEGAYDIPLEEWSLLVYEYDVKMLDEADLLIFLSYGKENNAGSVWECGYAFAKGIPVIMIKMSKEYESIMLYGSTRAIINFDEINSYDWKRLPNYKTKINKLS